MTGFENPGAGAAPPELAANIRYAVVAEQDLTPDMRLAISDVLPPEWFPEDPAEAEKLRQRAWMQAEPYARALAYDGEQIVGHVGLVDVTTADSPITVHGIADVAVLPDYRGQGIGGRVLEDSVVHAREAGQAGAIMAATVVEPVTHALAKMGFSHDPSHFFFKLQDHPGMENRQGAVPERPEWTVSEGDRVSNRDWWIWTRQPVDTQVRIKQDF